MCLPETATRLSPSLPTSLPAFPGQTQHPASYPQLSLAPAAWTQVWNMFHLPSRKQRIRDPNRVGKERIMHIWLLGYTKSQILWHKFWFLWHKGKRKVFHTVDDREDSVRLFLKWKSPQIFPKEFQDFHRLRVSLYGFMLIQGLPEQLWDMDSKVLWSFWNESSDSTKCGIKTTENWHTQTSTENWWHL